MDRTTIMEDGSAKYWKTACRKAWAGKNLERTTGKDIR
jgi:hypothetical protein